MAGIWPCPSGARTTTAWDLSASRTTLSSSRLSCGSWAARSSSFPPTWKTRWQQRRLWSGLRNSSGPLHALVMSHCEGVNSGVLDTTVASFDRHYAVNVRAAWLLLAAFARQLPTGGGSVIALTSDATVGNVPYGATKGALDRLILASAHELGERGLRANLINPGPVDTGWMDEQTRTGLLKMQPTGRPGTPADTANLVCFLLSDQGQWINGQLLHSNGGFPTGLLPI